MSVIHTPDDRLRVFVSSTLTELAAERRAVRSGIEQLRLTPVMFEMGARPHPPRDLYLAYLERSDVFVGIYWQQYGWVAPGESVSGIEDEYLAAGDKPKLVYLRHPAPERAPELAAMLERISSDGLSYRRFSDAEELERLVTDDLALLLSERFAGAGSVPDEPGADPSVAPRVRAGEVRLPASPDRFVGRTRVQGELCDLLRDEGTRLVTLTGIGGIGKTRLAMQVAECVASSFADGVVPVMLAPLASADLVPAAIRDALGVTESYGNDPVAQLGEFLSTREMLLVLDNFEHVTESAGIVAALLSAAPKVKVLVTSREVLHLSGEHVYAVPPLDVPSGAESVEELLRTEGVALFVERARSAGAGLELDDGQVSVIARMVRRLDGLPLAIELAASRVRVLSPADILARLDDRFAVLKGGSRDLPERQRTLRLTMQWSYDLLEPAERELFDRLGVFSGGFGLESAEAICRGIVADGCDALDGVEALVDRSLVVCDTQADGRARFRMLETVRQFALERLAERGLEDELREQHARWFLSLALATEPGYEVGEELAVLDRFEADEDNLRSALAWFTEHDPPAAARLAVALWRFWWGRSRFREGIESMERLLSRSEFLSRKEQADASLILGYMCWGLSDYVRGEPALRSALVGYTASGDELGIPLAALAAGSAGYVMGRDDWEHLLQTADELAEKSGNRWIAALASDTYGAVLVAAGRCSEAVDFLERSVDHSRAVGTRALLSYGLIYLGRAQLELGALEDARTALAQALDAAALVQVRETVARVVEAFSALATAAGDHERGALLFGAAESMRLSIGAPVWRPDLFHHASIEADLRQSLGAEGFEAAFAAGLALDLDEAVAAARAVDPRPTLALAG